MSNILTKPIRVPFYIEVVFLMLSTFIIFLYFYSIYTLRSNFMIDGRAYFTLFLSSFLFLPSIYVLLKFISSPFSTKTKFVYKLFAFLIGGLALLMGFALLIGSILASIFFVPFS